jgi:hypothetical protein
MEKRKRRCTAKSKSADRRCGSYAEPGTIVCRFHGGRRGMLQREIKWRLEVATALRDGTPHPATIFFELLKMRWTLAADGSELTCTVPTAQLGSAEDVRNGLAWVNHWTTVLNHREYREAVAKRKKMENDGSREEGPRSTRPRKGGGEGS